MHLFRGVVDTFSLTHTVHDALVGSCTLSEEEEEEDQPHLPPHLSSDIYQSTNQIWKQSFKDFVSYHLYEVSADATAVTKS